ncbi:MAG TPA: hypothetical protein VFQ61_03835 [Polyangiaceae bacterium]|nr:hypothetical protein [Polyangiaceae bacterium]
MLIAAALLVGLGVLVLFVLRERTTLASPAWMLLRCLLPAYRFFERVDPLPALNVRFGTTELGPWFLALEPPARRGFHLFLNPAGNLYLAHCSLVERFLDDLTDADPEQVPQLVSYELLKRLAARAACARLGDDPTQAGVHSSSLAPRFQFRLVERDAAPVEPSAAYEASQLFVSLTHELTC